MAATRREFLTQAAALAAGASLGPRAASATGGDNANLDRALLDEADRLLRAESENGGVAAATLVVRCGAFEFARAYGRAGIETPFLIASITKPMTATAAMLLIERGELNLTDPARKILPAFRGGERERVTIRHLLTHTSGLPDMLPDNVALRQRHAPLSEFLARTCETPLLFAPGTKVSYQSMGFLLLGAVVETIAARPLPAFLNEHVFAPLKMTGASLGLGGRALSQLARCEVGESSDWDWNSNYWRGLGAPWGGAHATARDIAAFTAHFARETGAPLDAAHRREMRTVQTAGLNEAWGLGWSCEPRKFAAACGPRTYGHSGSTGTLTWHDPDADLTFALLTSKPADVSRKTLLAPVSELIARCARRS